MQHIIQAATGCEELHVSINPALAAFDRILRGRREPVAGGQPSLSEENDLFLARAQAVVGRTRLAWN